MGSNIGQRPMLLKFGIQGIGIFDDRPSKKFGEEMLVAVHTWSSSRLIRVPVRLYALPWRFASMLTRVAPGSINHQRIAGGVSITTGRTAPEQPGSEAWRGAASPARLSTNSRGARPSTTCVIVQPTSNALEFLVRKLRHEPLSGVYIEEEMQRWRDLLVDENMHLSRNRHSEFAFDGFMRVRLEFLPEVLVLPCPAENLLLQLLSGHWGFICHGRHLLVFSAS